MQLCVYVEQWTCLILSRMNMFDLDQTVTLIMSDLDQTDTICNEQNVFLWVWKNLFLIFGLKNTVNLLVFSIISYVNWMKYWNKIIDLVCLLAENVILRHSNVKTNRTSLFWTQSTPLEQYQIPHILEITKYYAKWVSLWWGKY